MPKTETKEAKTNGPKKPSSAYLFFSIETIKKLTEKNPDLKQPEKMRKAGEVWKALNDKQKAKYIAMADEDKVRYEKQQKQFESKGWYTLADGSKSNSAENIAKASEGKSMKKKFGDDVLLPKKPMSAYMFFMA